MRTLKHYDYFIYDTTHTTSYLLTIEKPPNFCYFQRANVSNCFNEIPLCFLLLSLLNEKLNVILNKLIICKRC